MKGMLFGGCSFTWGQGLYFYSNLPNLYNPDYLYDFYAHKVTSAQIKFKNTLYYPRLVANHFKTFEVVNEINGGCEDKTFDFFNSIFENKKNIVLSNNNKYTYDDFDYIVIQLSSIVRNKFYYNINGKEFSTFFMDNKIIGKEDWVKDILKYMQINNYTFDDCYNQFLDQQFIRLKNELIFYESKGIKIKIMLWFDDLLERIENDTFFKNKLVTLNYDNKIFNTILELGDSYGEMYIITDPYFQNKKFNDYHPSKLLHQIIANGVIKSIEDDTK
jgi:hypothetical protein